MWPIIPSSFPPTPRVKTRGFNVSKTSYNSSTHFAYFNSWQKVDGETSIMRPRHHSRAYLEGLTKIWSFWGSSAPPYSPFCTLKMHTFDPIPLENPTYILAHLSQGNNSYGLRCYLKFSKTFKHLKYTYGQVHAKFQLIQRHTSACRSCLTLETTLWHPKTWNIIILCSKHQDYILKSSKF